MNHTIDQILPLRETEEGLNKLRILVAEADGESMVCYLVRFKQHGDEWKTWKWGRNLRGAGKCREEILGWGDEAKEIETYEDVEELPDYTGSLDEIFAAEERMGFHEYGSKAWTEWYYYAGIVLADTRNRNIDCCDYAHLTAPERCIILIMAAQKIKQNDTEK